MTSKGRAQFWLVIKDGNSKTYEVQGLSMDDTALINLVHEMQGVGMNVAMETPLFPENQKDSLPKLFAYNRFTEEKGLFSRLENELSERCRKLKS